MLDPWIIEEIRRREEEERHHRDERPVLELPVDRPTPPLDRVSHGESGGGRKGDRGVVILDFAI